MKTTIENRRIEMSDILLLGSFEAISGPKKVRVATQNINGQKCIKCYFSDQTTVTERQFTRPTMASMFINQFLGI